MIVIKECIIMHYHMQAGALRHITSIMAISTHIACPRCCRYTISLLMLSSGMLQCLTATPEAVLQHSVVQMVRV